jgi:hypothetical protein
VSRVALGLLLAAGLAALAHADTLYELPRTKVRLELPDAWKPVAMPGLVAAYKHPAGGVLAVTRADVPNTDAWKKDTRQAYADRVERGIKASVPGYKRVGKTLTDVSEVPTLDLEATRDTGATVLVRVLMFRTYALALAIEIPAKGDIAVARVIAQKFAPPPP